MSVNEHTPPTPPTNPPTNPLHNLPTIQVTLLVDDSPGGDHCYHVSVNVNDCAYDLGRYESANAAGRRMNDFIRGHGYEWSTDTARRVDAAQRNDAKVLILDAVPESSESRERRMAWVPFASDYIWQL